MCSGGTAAVTTNLPTELGLCLAEVVFVVAQICGLRKSGGDNAAAGDVCGERTVGWGDKKAKQTGFAPVALSFLLFWPSVVMYSSKAT